MMENQISLKDKLKEMSVNDKRLTSSKVLADKSLKALKTFSYASEDSKPRYSGSQELKAYMTFG